MRNALRSIAVAVLAVALVTESVWAAASYPISVKAFTTKATGEVVQAAHVNDLQDEVAAIEQALLTNGFEHVLKPKTTATYDLGTSTLGWQQLFLNLGTLTSDAQAIDITGTWNAAAVVFNLLKANITSTAANAASKFIDFQIGGSSRFRVQADGTVFLNGVGAALVLDRDVAGGRPYIQLKQGGIVWGFFGAQGVDTLTILKADNEYGNLIARRFDLRQNDVATRGELEMEHVVNGRAEIRFGAGGASAPDITITRNVAGVLDINVPISGSAGIPYQSRGNTAALNTAVGTEFVVPNGFGGTDATEANRNQIMDGPGEITRFRVDLEVNPANTATRTFTVRKNGVDTGLTVTYASTEQGLKVVTSTVSFSAGDRISISSAVGTAAAAVSQARWVLRMRETTI